MTRQRFQLMAEGGAMRALLLLLLYVCVCVCVCVETEETVREHIWQQCIISATENYN